MPTLSELYKRWLRAKKRARSSEQACRLAIDTCEKALGRLPINQLSRAHGDAFRSWLLDQPISAKTGASFEVCAKTHAHRDAVHQKILDRDGAMVLD